MRIGKKLRGKESREHNAYIGKENMEGERKKIPRESEKIGTENRKRRDRIREGERMR